MDLKYPIGEFQAPRAVTPDLRKSWIEDLAAAPARFRESVLGLDDAQLDTCYRPEGWTIRQVIHHVADSHMNSYIRFRLALTEDAPAIKPYDEARWAELHDARNAPVEISLQLLENLHHRWIALLRTLSESDFARTFHHPEHGALSLNTALAMYSWHSRHHAAHITGLKERMRW